MKFIIYLIALMFFSSLVYANQVHTGINATLSESNSYPYIQLKRLNTSINLTETLGNYLLNTGDTGTGNYILDGNFTAGRQSNTERQTHTVYTGVNEFIKISNIGAGIPEMSGSSYAGFLPLFAFKNGLYLHGTDAEPTLSFFNDALTTSANILFDREQDRLGFDNAVGGYRFLDGDIEIRSDTKGLIFGADGDYKISGSGSNILFNSNGNNLDHIFWDKDGHDLFRIYSGAPRYVQIGYNGDNADLAVIGTSKFGLSPSQTLIDVGGDISQTGLATAQFNEINITNNDRIYIGGTGSINGGYISYDSSGIMIFNTNYSGVQTIAYFTNNLSAENLIDRSWYWNKDLGNALDYISNDLTTSKDLPDFEKTNLVVTDYSRKNITQIPYENCTTTFIPAVYDTISIENENPLLPNDTIDIVIQNETKIIECQKLYYNETSYPYTTDVTGRVISVSIGKHEQAIYELNQKIEALEQRVAQLEK